MGLYWMDTLLQIKALLLEIGHDYKAKLGPHLPKSDRIVQNRTLSFQVRHYRRNSDTVVGNHCSVLLSFNLLSKSVLPLLFPAL